MATLQKRLKRAGIVAVFTFGFTALAAVLSGPGPATVGPAIAVFGWFVLAPAVAIFDLPVIDDGERETAGNGEDDETGPLETLQERYAAGEISEAEFDRKVERLLASGVDGTPSTHLDAGTDRGTDGDLSGTTDVFGDGVASVEDPTGDDGETGTDRTRDEEARTPGTETSAER